MEQPNVEQQNPQEFPLEREITHIINEIFERINLYNGEERLCLYFGAGRYRKRLSLRRITMWRSSDDRVIPAVYNRVINRLSEDAVNIEINPTIPSENERIIFLAERHCLL